MRLLQGPRIVVLLLLISFASISAVLFTPSLPELAEFFHISDSVAQQTMSVYLLGYTVGQLPYGPLANRFGRKRAIYIGLAFAFLGSLLCWQAPSFNWLLIGRFFQALGAAVGLKITFTMIGDSHEGSGATKSLSYILLAFAVMPGLGVAIGGFLTTRFGWEGCFLFLAGYTVMLALLCYKLPETARHLDHEALQTKRIIQGYFRQLRNPSIMLHSFLMGMGTSLIYVFASEAPYLGIERIGLTPEMYGLYNLIPPLGIIVGLMASLRLAGRKSSRINMVSGILVIATGVLIMAVSFANGWLNPWTLFIPQAIMMIGESLTFTNASSEALGEATDKSNASAIIQFINMGLGALSTFIVSALLPKEVMTVPTIFGAFTIISLGLWLRLKPHHRQSNHSS